MVWYGDSLAYLRQLRLTNFAESLESKPRHYVRRISFVSTILEDAFGADDVVKPLSAEDQDLLSWQAGTDNLQNDTEVREDLTLLSGRLCPYKNISLTLSGKVTDRDSHEPWVEPHPLSAYRHVSFRCAMLTDHSTSSGQVELLFSYDGLRDRDFLRWRSHDYIKLVFLEARPSYRVFWLVQWDIVDKLDPISGGQAATTGPGIMDWRPCLNHLAVDCQGDSTEKVANFHGIRRDAKRKSPWIAEVRPKGTWGPRDKIWLGSYPTPAAAARAADAGHYHFNQKNRLNFLDSPSHLQQIPRDLDVKDMEEFVKKEAHRLARIPPPGWIFENQSYNTSWAQGFSSPHPQHMFCSGNSCSSGSKQLPPNGNFVEVLPRLENFTAPLMNSGRGPGQTGVCEPSLPPVITVLSYPEENAEPDIPNEIALGGSSDSPTSQGLDSSLPGAESEWISDSYLIDWLLKIPVTSCGYGVHRGYEEYHTATQADELCRRFGQQASSSCEADQFLRHNIGRRWSKEDGEVLKWQPRTENWQNDFEVRDSLTNLSGRLCQGLCPSNNMGFSLFGKVTDNDTHQARIEPQSLSSYRHVSYCSVMLTKHSVPNEQAQLLFSCDGLPEDRSCLRWRSHDYIKLVLSDAKPSYRAFWLVQWDVVDMTDHVNDRFVASAPVTGLGINHLRPCLDPTTSERQSDDPVKFSGVRFRKKRKSPWNAEVRPKGSRNKISVGSYLSREAAARAVDAGIYHYNLNLDKLNFPDSLRFLDKTPPNLNEEALKAFVYEQAHRLAKLAEEPPSTGISQMLSCSTNTGGFTSRNNSSANNFGARNMRPVTKVSFVGLQPLARPDGFATPSMDSGSDLQENIVDVRPSTSFGSGVLREPVARNSPEENLLLSTSSNMFATKSAGDYHPEIEPTYTHEASFAPIRNSISGEATTDIFNVLNTAWDENPEQYIPDDSARRVSDIPSVRVSHSNHLIHEIESQSTDFSFPGYGFNPLVAGSEQAESNGGYGRDMDLFDWTSSEEGC